MKNAAAKHVERRQELKSQRPLGLGYLVREAFRALSARIDSELEAYSLSHSQWVSMLLLSKAGTMTPLELARAVGITKASATSVIEFLRSNNFLATERDADDGRKLNLTLTPKGIDVIDEIATRIDEIAEQVQVGATKQEFETFKRVLILITKNARDC